MASPLLANSQLLLLILTCVLSSIRCLEQDCDKLTHPGCKLSAGYDYTAPFSPINGQPYQEAKGKELQVYLPLLSSCSKHSATILCSLYFPKCVTGVPRPVLPCRSVCNDFVNSCTNKLNLAALHGILAAMCDLLPEYMYSNETNNCFLPKGFNISQAKSGIDKNVCHKVEIKQCSDDLHYNYTFISNTTQSLSNDHIMQSIIASNCSPNVEKFTCFTRFPPCFDGNKTKVQVPCKSLCNDILNTCRDTYRRHSIPVSDCDILYPDIVSSTGLCTLSKWPAPWQTTRATPAPRAPICPTMAIPTSYPECKRCDPVTIKYCKKAGYKNTFRFKDIDGKPYQEAKVKSLFAVPLLDKCSKLTQTILCSIFLPKCDETTCSSKPVLPCRSVCHQFVRDCAETLRLAALHGMMVGLCDLLPSSCTSDNPCIIPPTFKQTSGAYDRGTCFSISNSHNTCANDLHYNTTFLVPLDQMKVKFHLLQPIVDSKCSPYVEKLFCYTRLPPCSSNSTKDLSVDLPCRWMCLKVLKDCGDLLKKSSIPLFDCDFLPEGKGVNGMCRTSTFPVPLRHIKSELIHTNTGDKSGSNVGMVVGILFALIIVTILIVVGIIYFRWKKQQKPFEPKELHNIGGNEK